MTKFISEVYDNIHSAEQACQAAIAMGYSPEEINLIMSEETHKQYHGQAHTISIEHENTAKSILKGSAVGGMIGATFGVLTGIIANAMAPGVGVMVAGPILSGIATTAAGALGGGLAEFLLSHTGITEEEASKYEQEIKNGSIMIAINATLETAEALKAKWKIIKDQI